MNYILYGQEYYLIKKELNRIINDCVTFEKEMNTSYFDASKATMEEIIADAQTLPFFSEQKVVVVQQANFLCANGNSDMDMEVLEKYADSPNPTTNLILVCNEAKLDMRKKIVKRLIKEFKTLKFDIFNDFERSQFTLNQSKLKNLKFKGDALNEFYYRVGHSPARIISEIDKLSTYSSNVAKEDVIALVTRPLEDNVFNLFQCILNNNFKQSYSYWKDFDSQNIDPIALIAMLASQFRFLHQVKILQQSGYNKSEITRELGAHPFRVEKTLESAHQRSEDEIGLFLKDLALLDQKIKAGKIDKKLGFELFLIQKGKK